jgi:hypothetical protein
MTGDLWRTDSRAFNRATSSKNVGLLRALGQRVLGHSATVTREVSRPKSIILRNPQKLREFREDALLQPSGHG